MIEIQIRTELQHLWAELSEKFSDVVDQTIKYGGGDKETRKLLVKTSSLINTIEQTETTLPQAQASLSLLADKNPELVQQIASIKKKIADIERQTTSSKHQIFEVLRDSIGIVEKQRGNDDFFD